jgi:hypothetical protein
MKLRLDNVWVLSQVNSVSRNHLIRFTVNKPCDLILYFFGFYTAIYMDYTLTKWKRETCPLKCNGVNNSY